MDQTIGRYQFLDSWNMNMFVSLKFQISLSPNKDTADTCIAMFNWEDVILVSYRLQ